MFQAYRNWRHVPLEQRSATTIVLIGLLQGIVLVAFVMAADRALGGDVSATGVALSAATYAAVFVLIHLWMHRHPRDRTAQTKLSKNPDDYR